MAAEMIQKLKNKELVVKSLQKMLSLSDEEAELLYREG
jgi:hypothetical protein